MLGICTCVILTEKNVCKSLVEPRCVILARFSIFSIQLRFIVQKVQVYTVQVQIQVLSTVRSKATASPTVLVLVLVLYRRYAL